MNTEPSPGSLVTVMSPPIIWQNFRLITRRLRRLPAIYVSNANKFTEKGTVTIAARQKQENGRDWVTLSRSPTPASA